MRSHPPSSRYQDEPRILESHRQNFLPFAYRAESSLRGGCLYDITQAKLLGQLDLRPRES